MFLFKLKLPIGDCVTTNVISVNAYRIEGNTNKVHVISARLILQYKHWGHRGSLLQRKQVVGRADMAGGDTDTHTNYKSLENDIPSAPRTHNSFRTCLTHEISNMTEYLIYRMHGLTTLECSLSFI